MKKLNSLLPAGRLYDMTSVFTALIIMGGCLGGMLLLIPFFAIWTWHKRKIEEIRARQKVDIAAETRAAIDALRAEMGALRDTTTEYDVSFDTALHRLESRMRHVEQQVGAGAASVEVEQVAAPVGHRF